MSNKVQFRVENMKNSQDFTQSQKENSQMSLFKKSIQ